MQSSSELIRVFVDQAFGFKALAAEFGDDQLEEFVCTVVGIVGRVKVGDAFDLFVTEAEELG